MFSNREVFSIPGKRHDLTKASPGSTSGGRYDPILERLNFQNPDQNADLNMHDAAVMYSVGGMFSLWSGFAPSPEPFERTPLISDAEWDVVLPIAHKLYDTHDDAFEPSVVAGGIRKVLGDEGYNVHSPVMGAKKRGFKSDLAHFVTWTGADTILGPLADDPERFKDRFEILAEHRAEKLVMDEGHGEVKYATVRDLTNFQEKRIRADTFIVAGGAFLTPRLLWQSGIRPFALGRFLHENTVATCKIGLGKDVIDAIRENPANPESKSIIPIPWNDPAPKVSFAPTRDKPWMGHISRTGRTMLYDLPQDVRFTMDMTWYGTVEPRPENRITFSDTIDDRFGQPQITFEYRPGPADAALASRMLEELAMIAPKIGGYLPLARPPFTSGPALQPPGASLHMMGTYRMGDDSDDSVVDADSQVWGMENLYLGGLGVIPNKIASNPTLTASAIAVKSVSHILGMSVSDLEEKPGLAQ
jgi:pyranose oxidase